MDLNDWEDSLLDDAPSFEDEPIEEPTEDIEDSFDNEEDGDLLDTFLKSKGINPIF